MPDGYLSADEGLLSDDDADEEGGAPAKLDPKDPADKERKDPDEEERLKRRKRMRDEAKALLYQPRKDATIETRLGVFLGAVDDKTQARRSCWRACADDAQGVLKEFAVMLLDTPPIKRASLCRGPRLTRWL